MRAATTLFTLAILSVPAVADDHAAGAQRAPEPTGLPATAQMLDPIQIDQLSLTPIVTTKPEKSDLLVLDEAMAKKLVRIHEVSDGEVNSLTLTNDAKQPLFLLAGEVVLGGKQDRIIGRNTIIPAKTTLEVPVFCVEHGRWEGDTAEFHSAKALAHGKLRGKASFESQGAVWDEVHDKNEKRKTSNGTDTYRQVAQSETEGSIGKLSDKVTAAIAKLPADKRANLIGFAVAINGKVQTVDVFQSPDLFTKLEAKLVRSYVADAVDTAIEKDAKPPKAADVTTFMADAAKAKDEASYETKASHTFVKKGVHADSATVTIDPAPAAPAVYQTYEAK
jgi:hypothetical protein